MQIKELDYGNCGIARFRGKEAYVKDMGLRTTTGYKAGMAGELAQHSEAHSSAMKVNPEVVYRNNMLLPGEASSPCVAGLNPPRRRSGASSNGRVERRGVSRGHSSREQRAGSSCRRVSRPAKVSGWLTRGEGPNLASGTDRGGLRMFGRFASWRTVFRRTVRIVESFC